MPVSLAPCLYSRHFQNRLSTFFLSLPSHPPSIPLLRSFVSRNFHTSPLFTPLSVSRKNAYPAHRPRFIVYRCYSSRFSDKFATSGYVFVLFGVVSIFGYVGYTLYNLMGAPTSPVRIYNDVLDIARKDPKVVSYFGPNFTGHGDSGSGGISRNRSIKHSYAQYKNTPLKLMIVQFYIDPAPPSFSDKFMSAFAKVPLYFSHFYNQLFAENVLTLETPAVDPSPTQSPIVGVVTTKLLEKTPNTGDYEYYSINVKIYKASALSQDDKLAKITNLNLYISKQAQLDYSSKLSLSKKAYTPKPPSGGSSWLGLITPSSWS
ncbi:Mitochondrial import inner membrane translocase subunit Tim21 [Smittium mucronatum]|uniref:Mitochondrial import inner membrane translocase subunit Tim21 n=1 Tax=Smittium mucronatum TaxID=133383 RepID=A0A1R0GPR8_9FUNG|nr:Mitochondrial import inner membrane translocase subunit Tim21 [Smittium mucronatum]